MAGGTLLNLGLTIAHSDPLSTPQSGALDGGSVVFFVFFFKIQFEKINVLLFELVRDPVWS